MEQFYSQVMNTFVETNKQTNKKWGNLFIICKKQNRSLFGESWRK